MQSLLTVFANPAVHTAAVSLNDDTIGNLAVSESRDAKPANYVFTRAEMETYLKEQANARTDDTERDQAKMRAFAEASVTWWSEFVPRSGIDEVSKLIAKGPITIG